MQAALTKSRSDAELAVSLARLWPHREHESSGSPVFFAVLVFTIGDG